MKRRRGYVASDSDSDDEYEEVGTDGKLHVRRGRSGSQTLEDVDAVGKASDSDDSVAPAVARKHTRRDVVVESSEDDGDAVAVEVLEANSRRKGSFDMTESSCDDAAIGSEEEDEGGGEREAQERREDEEQEEGRPRSSIAELYLNGLLDKPEVAKPEEREVVFEASEQRQVRRRDTQQRKKIKGPPPSRVAGRTGILSPNNGPGIVASKVLSQKQERDDDRRRKLRNRLHPGLVPFWREILSANPPAVNSAGLILAERPTYGTLLWEPKESLADETEEVEGDGEEEGEEEGKDDAVLEFSTPESFAKMFIPLLLQEALESARADMTSLADITQHQWNRGYRRDVGSAQRASTPYQSATPTLPHARGKILAWHFVTAPKGSSSGEVIAVLFAVESNGQFSNFDRKARGGAGTVEEDLFCTGDLIAIGRAPEIKDTGADASAFLKHGARETGSMLAIVQNSDIPGMTLLARQRAEFQQEFISHMGARNGKTGLANLLCVYISIQPSRYSGEELHPPIELGDLQALLQSAFDPSAVDGARSRIYNLTPLGSMITASREAAAISALPYICPRISKVLLHPSEAETADRRVDSQKGSSVDPPPGICRAQWDALAQKYNQAQLKAVAAIAVPSTSGFMLLQGPPGTGKTNTVLGVLSVFLGGVCPKPLLAAGGRGNGSLASSETATVGSGARITVGAALASKGGELAKARGAPLHRGGGHFGRGSPTTVPSAGGVRVLLCAPSNAAVDEVCLRILREGVVDTNGKRRFPRIVRVGSGSRLPKGMSKSDASATLALSRSSHQMELEQDEGLKPTFSAEDLRVLSTVTLESLVEREIGESREERRKWHGRKRKTDRPGPPPMGVAAARLKVLKAAEIVCATLSGAGSDPLTDAVLGEGGERDETNLQAFKFDAVVIDEAAQAVEPSTLIPLRHNPDAVVLVGDPAQLPATVLSRDAQARGYGGSLFERLQAGGFPRCHFLDTQYRMHPKIARIVSSMFYSKKGLKTFQSGPYRCPPWYDFKLSVVPTDGQDASERVNVRLWIPQDSNSDASATAEEPSGPLVFHNIQYGRMTASTAPSCHGSWMNFSEAEFVVKLYKRLEDLMFRRFWLRGKLDENQGKDSKDETSTNRPGRSKSGAKKIKNATDFELSAFRSIWAGRVGIIAPYRGQAFELRKQFRAKNVRIPEDVEVSTVDGFQGREKDLIILTTTRAPLASRERSGAGEFEIDNDTYLTGIGFLKDRRRLNVAISRAKHSLWIVGHAYTLTENSDWDTLLKADGMCVVDYSARPWVPLDATKTAASTTGQARSSTDEARLPSMGRVPWRPKGMGGSALLGEPETLPGRPRTASESSRGSDITTGRNKKRAKKKTAAQPNSHPTSGQNISVHLAKDSDPRHRPREVQRGTDTEDPAAIVEQNTDRRSVSAENENGNDHNGSSEVNSDAKALLGEGEEPSEEGKEDVVCRPS